MYFWNRINGLTARSDEEEKWLTKILTEKNKKEISTWKMTSVVESNSLGKILFCHGTPRSNQEVFTPTTTHERLNTYFDGISVSFIVCGHSHIQFEIELGGIRIINAGSEGTQSKYPYAESFEDTREVSLRDFF